MVASLRDAVLGQRPLAGDDRIHVHDTLLVHLDVYYQVGNAVQAGTKVMAWPKQILNPDETIWT